jgi:hypothetical protein
VNLLEIHVKDVQRALLVGYQTPARMPLIRHAWYVIAMATVIDVTQQLESVLTANTTRQVGVQNYLSLIISFITPS